MASLTKPYRGVTKAYRAFGRILHSTTSLLEAGVHGITGKTDEVEGVLAKFEGFKGPRGPAPKDYEPEIKSKPTGRGKRELSMDARSAQFVKKAIQSSMDFHKKLRFHLYALLTTSVWGHFETYIVMLFGELFTRQPAILKSGRQITFEEAVDNRADILGHIADKQLDAIGHFSLQEHLDYLSNRLGFKFTDARKRKLAQYYLVRNIISHNSGYVRPGLKSKLPQDIQVIDGEVRITRQFIDRMLRDISSATHMLEKHVEKKFF